MRIGVLGAGLIGTYVGVRLSAAGHGVTLVTRSAPPDGRPVAVDLSDEHFPSGNDLVTTKDAAALANVEAVLACVKSQDTAAAAETIRAIVPRKVPVISLQNGIRNVPVLRESLPNPIVPGMVTFNVRRDDALTYRRTTSGPLLLAPGTEAARTVVETLVRAGEEAALRDDMEAILATKLLLNLNNGLCALTGLAVADSVRDRDLRACFSMCITEGMTVMRRAGVPLTSIGPLTPGLVAKVLKLPDFLFRQIARPMMSIDPRARSSTLQDLDAGKPTEIDWLNGEIARLAAKHGLPAPVNARVAAEVHRLEKAGLPPPFLTPKAVRTMLVEAVSS